MQHLTKIINTLHSNNLPGRDPKIQFY